MKCDDLKYERLGDAFNDYPDSTLVIRKQYVDAAIDELKQIIKYEENVGQRWFDRCMDARTLWVKNTRALWLARAKRAIEKIAWFKLWNASISTMNPEDGARQEYDKWKKALGKFLAKAEKFK